MIIDGKKTAAELRDELKKKIIELKSTYNAVPGLTVILIGDLTPSQIYVRNKEKSANEVGLKSEVIKYPDSVEEKTVLKKIDELNNDNTVSGILVQLPLPKHINADLVLDTIVPIKDVDGFHAENVGKLWSGLNSLVPCTPLGCSILLKKLNSDLSGKNAIIIGRSNIVGKPMSQLLIEESCTVTVVHSKTKEIEKVCSQADIIVAAIGRAEMIDSKWLKDGEVVIDVGINRIAITKEDGSEGSKIVGDVDFESASTKASKITPVPGGVGPMTIACLLRNTVTSAYRHAGLEDPRSN